MALGREAAFVSTTEGKTLIFSRAGKMQTQSEPRNQEASPHPILAKGPGVSMCVCGGGGGQGESSREAREMSQQMKTLASKATTLVQSPKHIW